MRHNSCNNEKFQTKLKSVKPSKRHLMIRRGGLFERTYNIYFYSETNRKNKKDKQQKYKLYVKTKKIIHDDTLTTYDM